MLKDRPKVAAPAIDRTAVVFVRNIASSWVSRVASMATTFLVTPVLIHGLGREMYGLWAVALTLTGYLALIDVGVTGGLVRAISVANARGHRDRIAGLVATAFAFYFLVGAGLLLAVYLLHAPIVHLLGVPAHLVSITEGLLIGVTAVLVIGNLTAVFNQVFTALEKIHITGTVTFVLTALNALSVIGALVIFHAGIQGLVVANVLASLITLVLSGSLAKRICSAISLAPRRVNRKSFREIVTLSLAIQLSNIAGVVNFSVDKLILAGFIGLTSAGIYDLASRLTFIIWMLSWMVASAAFPVMSRLSEESPAVIRQFYLRAERYLQIATCGLAGGLIVVAPWLIPLWLGPGFPRVIVVTQILAVSSAALGFTQVAKVTLWGMKRVKEMTIFELWRLSAHIAFSSLLTWRFGFYGAPAGALLAVVIPSIWIIIIAHRRLGVSNVEWLRSAVAGPVASAIVAGTTAFLAMHWVIAPLAAGTNRLTFLVLTLCAGSMFTVIYLPVLIKLNVFAADDLAALRQGRTIVWGRVREFLGASSP